ncbi:Spy/CpxP family protein refolding chaperone [Pseudothauera rhizosphaerae]|nr:Spy/CpxP family protein refolding chaperone [Pseudothauera rhizosphaerae]
MPKYLRPPLHWLAAALSVALLGAGPAAAFGPQPGPEGAFEAPFQAPPHFVRLPDLSEAQQDQLFELTHAQAPRLRQLQREISATREALRALAGAETFDAAKARTLADRHGRAVAALQLAHAELEARSRAVLTPEQRRALAAASAAHDQARDDRGGPRGAPPQRP